MTTIGVRELRQRTSEFLRRVEAGETIEVTDRGRPVALLSPIREASALQRLRRSGDLVAATEGELPEPLEPASNVDLPSAALASLRADER